MNKNRILSVLGALGLFAVTGSVYAIPTLQVGAPAGAGDTGTYADYQVNTTDPVETDTAITSGGTLYVAGAYSNNADLLIGGQYGANGLDWSDFGFSSAFDGSGAILMATAFGTGTLTVDSNNAIYSTPTYEDGFVLPNINQNHDPIKEDSNSSYLFFDIGNFAKNELIPNLFDEVLSNQMGEIKELSLDSTGYDWIHFDVFALITDERGNSRVVTSLEGNPNSKDVTWKNCDGGNCTTVPEPGTALLLGLGLIGIGLARARKRAS